MTTISNRYEKLPFSRLQLFRNVDLECENLLHLLDQCEYKTISRGEVILSKEVENHNLYIIIKGQLAVKLEGDSDISLAIMEPGECVGEISMIDNLFPSAHVSASEETTLLQINQNLLWGMVNASHGITRNLLYILCERVRNSNSVITESMELQRKYQQFATIDSLTGIHNRGWLENAFNREIIRSDRDHLPLSLIMIDIDNFKSYNDNLGHLAGDRILIVVAEAIRTLLRPNDMVARFGGEEFVVLLPETELVLAHSIADRLCKYVCNLDPGVLGETHLPKVTISLGVAEHQHGCKLISLIDSADLAMYRAKNNGKNCVEIAG